MRRKTFLRLLARAAAVAATAPISGAFAAERARDARAGARLFRACAACHSLEPGQAMTGPSLSGVWGRRAGTESGFPRYSPALEHSPLIWDEKTLDTWLADPKAVVPGTTMTFPGLPDPQARADVIAFLKTAGAGGAAGAQDGGAMGGMMGGGTLPDLKTVEPARRVTAIGYCGRTATYRVTTADGKTRAFWERNLRFKTDAGQTGPAPGRPAIMPAGMMGDRASVIFAAPGEIGAFIKADCQKGNGR